MRVYGLTYWACLFRVLPLHNSRELRAFFPFFVFCMLCCEAPIGVLGGGRESPLIENLFAPKPAKMG